MWLGLSMTVVAQGHWIVETPDLVKTQAMMETASEEQGRDMAGLVLPASFSFFEQAEHEVKGGHELWTLSISAPGALAMSVYFDDFHLPSGAELYFRTPEGKFDETWEEGPVNVLENNAHRRWVNGDVPGDEVVMTYRAPLGLTESAALRVSGIGYMARHVGRRVQVLQPAAPATQKKRLPARQRVGRIRLRRDPSVRQPRATG